MKRKKTDIAVISRGKKREKLKQARQKKPNLYSSLSYKYKAKKEESSRKRAEELAKLPKDPWKRFLVRLHPKRFFRWWFSWRGQKAILKFCVAGFLLAVIFVGGLFLYYKKDLDAIKLDEIVISKTVNTYLDRNGVVLWEDKGSEDYRLVVEGDEISSYMRQATVAIEDKNFYSHPGVDFLALVRATFATLSGRGVQGGSTLTQQLIKQVYFADEAVTKNRGGITRKIKELILAISLERMYSKEQIVNMYLNQSPYGGRRNGVESAARTYFGKSAKDLDLAESALLAAIPNNPGVLNPYNSYGHEKLISRQHKTLDAMVVMGYVSEEEAESAKKVAILDTIKPEVSQYSDILAPHFVLEAKTQLERKYGISTMRAGGFTIRTTLDYEAQKIAETAVATGAEMMAKNGSDNIALASVDVETSQVIAMVGSSNWNAIGYGQVNAATSLLEPGSSIKPLLDYVPLFTQREGINYGPGTILKDENIDSVYCAGSVGACKLRNYTGKFYGNVTVRQALANSLNIPAVKALYINKIENSLKILHDLGDESYCKNSNNAGLSMAIGSGCMVRPVEHANAYASIARGGAYKPLSYVLELKNSSGDVLESWTDTKAKQVVDPQVAYMLSSILSDAGARNLVFGSMARAFGFVVPGVWTAVKTGTTTTASSTTTKDSWIASYSPAISTVVWNGKHDGSGLRNSSNNLVRRVIHNYIDGVHKQVYAKNGKWKVGDEPVKPAGIKTLTVNGKTDIWPSWYDDKKHSGVLKETLTFNRYNHLLASECTLDAYKIEVEVTKITDPMSGKEVYNIPEPYNNEVIDTCDYIPPTVTLSRSGTKKLQAIIKKGSYDISWKLYIDEELKEGVSIGSLGQIEGLELDGTEKKAKIIVSDVAGYDAVSEIKLSD